MTHLIRKNLSIHKEQWFIYIGLLVFFLLFNKDVIFIVSFVSAIIIMNEFYFDEKANGDKLWNSLPFTRNEVVSARYISLFPVTFVCISLVVIFEFITGGTREPAFWKQVLGSIILLMVSAAICFPILYWLAKRKIAFALFILYIFLVFGGCYLFYYGYLYIRDTFIYAGYLTDSLLFTVLIFLAVVLYLISWRVSVTLYQKRDII